MRTLFFTGFLLTVIIVGCQESLTNQVPEPATAPTKMRQAHLFGTVDAAGKILERYAELVTYTEFVAAFSTTVLDMQRVLERYEDFSGATIKQSYEKAFKGFAIHVDAAQVPAFLVVVELDPDIAWLEPDIKVMPPKPTIGPYKPGNGQVLPWGVNKLDADISSTRAGDGTGSVTGVEVYVLDSGIKADDLTVVEALDFSGSGHTNDLIGHGTHISGIIGAQDNTFGVVGVAPGINLHNFKVLNDLGQTELSIVMEAIDVITARKVANPSVPIVVNLSFGADIGTKSYNALDAAIASSIAQGVVYVVAAGNEGINAQTVTPAHVSEAITIGAYDDRTSFATFSNFGAGLDLLAPGVNIVSTSHAVGTKPPPVLMSGTSMAAPHVTGAVAIYLSQNPAATPQQVRDALVGTAMTWTKSSPPQTTKQSVYVATY